MNLTDTFKKAFVRKKERGWKHIYVFVDIHDTIHPADYGKEDVNYWYFPDAKEVLQTLSNRRDIVLVLYTSSYPKDIEKHLEVFEADSIHFQLINENKMEKNSEYACFDMKPYFNVLIDDKAGFNGVSDWYPILKYLKMNPVG